MTCQTLQELSWRLQRAGLGFRMAERVMIEADEADVTGRFSQVEQERGLTGWFEIFANEVARQEELTK